MKRLQKFVFFILSTMVAVTSGFAQNKRPAPVFELKKDGQLVSESNVRRKHQTKKRTRKSVTPTQRKNASHAGSRKRVRGLVHVVKRGETLKSIARKYGRDHKYLAYINHLKPPYRIVKGQALIIRRRQASGTASTRLKYSSKTKRINPITYVTAAKGKRAHLIYSAGGGKAAVRYKKGYQRKTQRQYKPEKTTAKSNHTAAIKPQKLTGNKAQKPTNFVDKTGKTPTKFRKQATLKQSGLELGGDPIGENKVHGKSTQTASIGASKRAPVATSSRFTAGSRKKQISARKLQEKRARIYHKNRKVHWAWPVRGRIAKKYSRSLRGIDIAGRFGQAVKAAASGQVVYIGNSLIRYGNLVILKHSSRYFSAYAHNKRIVVTQGQVVQQGEKIAEMGATGANSVKLHFEIRKDGKPVNPFRYLSK